MTSGKIKDRETKVSSEGVKSTHVEHAGGRVDCTISIPVLQVKSKSRNRYETWPKIGSLYVPFRSYKEIKKGG